MVNQVTDNAWGQGGGFVGVLGARAAHGKAVSRS